MSITPNHNDVLFGMGAAINTRPGNISFRSIISARRPEFLQAKKREKRGIAINIVHEIQRLNPPGRFLILKSPNGDGNSRSVRIDKEALINGEWECVTTEKAINKVMHRLREKEGGEGSKSKDSLPQSQPLLQSGGSSNQVSLPSTQPSIGVSSTSSYQTDAQSPNNNPSPFELTEQQYCNTFDVPSSFALGASNSLSPSAQNSIPMGASTQLILNMIRTSSNNGSCPLTGVVHGQNRCTNAVQSTLFDGPTSTNDMNKPNYQHQQAVSLAEFLKSGCMNMGTFLLQNENETGYISGSDMMQPQLVMENAVRVAMMLSRSFVEYTADVSDSASCQCLESIDLDDFSIQILEREHGNAAAATESDVSLPNGEEKKMNEAYNLQYKSGCGNLGLGNVANITRSSVLDMDNNLSSDECSEQASARQMHGNREQRHWSIVSIDIKREKNSNNGGHHHHETQMQHLGMLLYSVFSQGKPFPPDLCTVTTTTRTTCHTEELHTLRSYKTSRKSNKSTFTKLMENEAFPSSICRLISDLLDSGPECNSDSSFTSLDNAIHDLQLMVSRPLIFLHDITVAQSPTFGRHIHGRKEEMGRVFEVATKMMVDSSSEASVALEAMFISGVAGSGKSAFVNNVGEHLSSLGWLVAKTKFERGKDHSAKSNLFIMFDAVISQLTNMKRGGKPLDIDHISKRILDDIGYDGLSRLVDFMPSLSSLYDGINSKPCDSNESIGTEWQSIYSLSAILHAILEQGLYLVLHCDDLQWADRTSIFIMSEVLINLSGFEDTRRHLLFVGMYRQDEVGEQHPFTSLHLTLKTTENVNVSIIQLEGLSKREIAGMLMMELRLPYRFVIELADVVHKRTLGLCFFVVQLMNALIRDSTIMYSPQNRRYTWDQSALSIIHTKDNIAKVIASNISSLSEEYQRILWILSSFGVTTDLPLLQVLELYQPGILSSIDFLVERGILDQAAGLVIFAHDLIQEHIYESISLAQRQTLHLSIGIFLGQVYNDIESSTIDHVTSGIGNLRLRNKTFFAGRSLTSSLISLACDQINAVESDAISDQSLRKEAAGWNLSAGDKSAHQSDFRCAHFYYMKGIQFLNGDSSDMVDLRLSLALHRGASSACFLLGDGNQAVQYADNIKRHVSLRESLEVEQIALKALVLQGQCNECISRGLDLLRRLDFDLPSTPNQQGIVNAVTSAKRLAAKFSREKIVSLCERTIDASAHSIVTILNSFLLAAYALPSPYLPLIACEIVKYSLKNNGFCPEAMISLTIYAIFEIYVNDDYATAKYWVDIVRDVVYKQRNQDFKAQMLALITVDIFFVPSKDLSPRLLKVKDDAMRLGQVDTAMIALHQALRFRVFGGEKLSFIAQSAEAQVKLMSKHSTFCAKYARLEIILLGELMGKNNELSHDYLQSEVNSSSEARYLHQVHFYSFLVAFWKGDYLSAEQSSHATLQFPTARMPYIIPIYHQFYGALTAFHLYRMLGGDERFAEGVEMMQNVSTWAKVSADSMKVFGNKYYLLQAEYAASINDYKQARQKFEASIKVAQDCGNVHEMALALERMGEHYFSCGCGTDANDCYKSAHEFYVQWGATAIANKLSVKHNLDINASSSQVFCDTNKGKRLLE